MVVTPPSTEFSIGTTAASQLLYPIDLMTECNPLHGTNIGVWKLASFDNIWAAFSAYVPLGPKYATCLRMINRKKKRDQMSIGGI